jgi:molybdopterin molybdotransferase
MKPGAPLAYVVLDGRPVFGLPGNPVSSLVTFEQFVRPALQTMMGHTDVFRPVERAQLSEDYRKPAGRAHFVRVRVHSREGRLHATPTGDQSSGVLLSMVQANGLVFVPEDETWLRAGGEVPVIMLRRDDLRPEPGY